MVENHIVCIWYVFFTLTSDAINKICLGQCVSVLLNWKAMQALWKRFCVLLKISFSLQANVCWVTSWVCTYSFHFSTFYLLMCTSKTFGCCFMCCFTSSCFSMWDLGLGSTMHLISRKPWVIQADCCLQVLTITGVLWWNSHKKELKA